MKKVYPRYADQVAFYAVGTDPTESLEHLKAVRQKAGYPWPVAVQAGQDCGGHSRKDAGPVVRGSDTRKGGT